MAERGPIAPPSSDEDMTLQRVAPSIAQASENSPRDLARRTKPTLVEIEGETPRLTAPGRHRRNEQPRALLISDLKSQADYGGLLANHVGDPGRW